MIDECEVEGDAEISEVEGSAASSTSRYQVGPRVQQTEAESMETAGPRRAKRKRKDKGSRREPSILRLKREGIGLSRGVGSRKGLPSRGELGEGIIFYL